MKKILVTGAGGQLGREWKRFLQQKDGCNPEFYGSSELDITDFPKVKRLIADRAPDYVINCAAYTHVDRAEEETDKADNVNNGAVSILAKACGDCGAQLVHFSTDYVFPGDKKDKERLPDGYPEEYKKDPVNWYGQTKWRGEEAIRSSSCAYLIIRVSWLCGTFGNNFVKTMLRLADEHKELQVVADQWGSPTFAAGVVKNTFCLLEQGREGTYHYSSEGLISWADFAEEIFILSGNDITVKRISSDEYPTKARRPSFSKLDTKKIEQVEGVELSDWREGLKALLQTLKN